MTKKLGSAFFVVLTALLVYQFAVRYYFGEAREDAIDFPSYYYGAKLAFELHTSPYTNTGWNIAEEQYKKEAGEGTLFPFLYPPPSLPFFRLFTLLEYETAKLLMLGMNHVLALTFILLFFFNILKLHTYNLLPIAGIYYFYNFFPLILTIYSGQVNLLILILICLTWLGVNEKWHPFAIALPLAFGIILKLYPVLFFITWLGRPRASNTSPNDMNWGCSQWTNTCPHFEPVAWKLFGTRSGLMDADCTWRQNSKSNEWLRRYARKSKYGVRLKSM